MSVRLTLKSLRDDLRIAPVANVCATDERLGSWASQFQERAFAMGRWWGSIQLARFCTNESCIVLPREVAVVEALNVGGRHTQLRNLFYDFVRPHSDFNCGTSLGVTRCNCGCGCGQINIQDKDTVSSFRTTTGSNRKLRTYILNEVDAGKKVIYQGYDANGTWVRTEDSEGNVIDGEEVILIDPFADTVTIWGPGSPTGVQKDETDYNIQLFSVDQDSAAEVQLGVYQPTEFTPTYRRIQIPRGSCQSGCGDNQSVTAIVGLQPTPVSKDQDWLLFRNLTAYKMGIQAEKYYESGDIAMGDAYFFGNDRPSRNGRGVLRHTYGMGALTLLESETRRMTGDLTTVTIEQAGYNQRGFL